MASGLVQTAALSAGNGAIIDVPREALDGSPDFLDDKFDRLLESGERTAKLTRVKIGEVVGGKAVLEITDGRDFGEAKVDFENLQPGGNAINTATAAAMVEKLMLGETRVRIYGPLNQVHQGLIADKTGLGVTNSIRNAEQRNAMPSRVSIVDSEHEKYAMYKPDFERGSARSGDLRFLVKHGVLVPMDSGDLILSSCINSRFFWGQIREYLHRNPEATLYFQPGSVHLGKLVENKPYLSRGLMESGRVVVILNVDEIKGFVDNLASQGLAELGIDMTTEIISGTGISLPLCDAKEAMALNIASELAKRGLDRVVITNGPGSIIDYNRSGEKATVYITAPEQRKNVESVLKSVGIDSPSEAVLSTGCGDTFTGALIALSRIYPEADKNTLMEAASIFSAIHTHNPRSNIGNLNLDPIRNLIIQKLGQPNPRDMAA